MLNFLRIRRSTPLIAAMLSMLALSASPLFAQKLSANTPSGTLANLQQRYPAGSIQSKGVADRALQDIKRQRAFIKKRYKAEEATCYREHFFANHCLSKARKQRQSALNEIGKIRLEAKRYKRRAALLRREKAIAKKQKEKQQLFAPHTPDDPSSQNGQEKAPSHSTPLHAKRTTACQE